MKAVNRWAMPSAIIVMAIWGLPNPALAQRTEDNAVTSANDAFGQSVGSEKIGLYNVDDVRGFSPIEAGNARIEGLFFAQVAAPPNRIVQGNTVRVGISAQGYPFPAPTGIVDYQLSLPSEKDEFSLSAERGQYGSAVGSVEARKRITDQLSFYVGLGRRHQNRHEGGDFSAYVNALSTAWRPRDGALVAAFFSFNRMFNDEAAPVIIPGGDWLPPKIERRQTIGQDWADRDTRHRMYGGLIKWPVGDWTFEAGLFRAERNQAENFTDLFTRIRADGTTANRVMVADINNRDTTTSGEVRLSRPFKLVGLDQRIAVSIRKKVGNRLFGGASRIVMGESSLLFRDVRPMPAFSFGEDDQDEVRQTMAGLSYGIFRKGSFALDMAVTKSRYLKAVNFANPATSDFVVRDRPWTGSLTGSVNLTSQLVAYGGHVRGFEEALIAPEIAVNRGSAPPAIRTRQSDVGLRYAFSPKLNFVAGLFVIRKPYFNIDPVQFFQELGTSTNRGAEISFAGTIIPGLNIVAGTVLTDANIKGPNVINGLIGSRPLGSVRRRTIFNIDWRPHGGKSPLSLDMNVESYSARVANTANTLFAPSQESVNLGLRYRFAVSNARGLFRLQMINAFNDYGWTVTMGGAFTYTRSRHILAELVLDI